MNSKRQKRLTNIIILFIMLAILMPAVLCVAQQCNDIEGHWAEKAISEIMQRDILSGYPDGTFQPDRSITRAEFTYLLVNALKLTGSTDKVFDDTQNHWAREAISIAYHLGIVNGYNETEFGPYDPLTREQAAVMLVNALDLSKTGHPDFIDLDTISPWARDSVVRAVAVDLLSGYPDNTFRPQNLTSRAESAFMIWKFFGLSQDIAPTSLEPESPSPRKEGGGSGLIVSVTGVTLDKNSIALRPGGSAQQLAAAVTPTNATFQRIIWSSSNPAVAIVEDGLVTPLTTGTATITAQSVSKNITAQCQVVVVPIPETAFHIPASFIIGQEQDIIIDVNVDPQLKLENEADDLGFVWEVNVPAGTSANFSNPNTIRCEPDILVGSPADGQVIALASDAATSDTAYKGIITRNTDLDNGQVHQWLTGGETQLTIPQWIFGEAAPTGIWNFTVSLAELKYVDGHIEIREILTSNTISAPVFSTTAAEVTATDLAESMQAGDAVDISGNISSLNDRFGNPVADGTYMITINSDKDGQVFGPTQVVFEDGTPAQSIDIVLHTADVHTLTIDVNGVQDNASITIIPAEAASQSVITQPTQTVAGNIIAPAPSIKVVDEFSNPVPDVEVTVNVSHENFASGTLALTTDVSGMVVFDDLVVNIAQTNYQLTFSTEGVDTISSIQFDVVPASVNTVAIPLDTDQTIAAGQDLLLTASARDVYGNLITADPLDFIWTNTTSGVFNETLVGEYAVTAEYDGVVSTATSVMVVPADAAFVTIGEITNHQIAGLAFNIDISNLEDTYRNIALDGDYTVTVNSDLEGTLLEQKDVNFTGGEAVQTISISPEQAGIHNLTVTVGNATAAITITVNPAEPAAAVVEPLIKQTTCIPFEVNITGLKDAFGNTQLGGSYHLLITSNQPDKIVFEGMATFTNGAHTQTITFITTGSHDLNIKVNGNAVANIVVDVAPVPPQAELNFRTEMISGVDDSMEYMIIDSGAEWEDEIWQSLPESSNLLNISADIPEPGQIDRVCYIRIKSTDNIPASDNQAIILPARPKANVYSLNTVYESTDGVLDEGDEYDTHADFSNPIWPGYPAAPIRLTENTTYYIRVRATDTSFASPPFTLVVPPRTPLIEPFRLHAYRWPSSFSPSGLVTFSFQPIHDCVGQETEMWIKKGNLELAYRKVVVEAWENYRFDLSTFVEYNILDIGDTLEVTLKIADRYKNVGDYITVKEP